MFGEKVSVIGIWHLGSVYSACLAHLGCQVVGVDRDSRKVENLNKGIPPLFEPGLAELVSEGIDSKRLSYTTDLSSALGGVGYVLITFDTPVNEADEVDLSEIMDTCEELSRYLESDSVIIVSSQVPVGTCERIKSLISQSNPSLDFDIAYSPENLRLGQAIERFEKPGRIVIGADSESTLDRVEELLSVVDAPKLRMNLRSAEMTKHALNAFLATSISFANEIANLCDEVGADAVKVAKALKTDERIGQRAFLEPGLGFAGGTLARDMKVLKNLGEEYGCETPLVNGVLRVNEKQNRMVIKKLERIYSSVDGLMVGVLGLTYKPNTSTLRRSAALEIIKGLTNRGAQVKAYDPKAALEEVQQHREFKFCADPYEASWACDALIIVTEWPEFRALDFDLIRSAMKRPVVIDAKNMLDRDEMVGMGFLYSGIGRGTEAMRSVRQ